MPSILAGVASGSLPRISIEARCATTPPQSQIHVVVQRWQICKVSRSLPERQTWEPSE